MTRAPTVFISYAHESRAHQDRVLALAQRLRSDGFDVTLDQYEASPPEKWPLWTERQILDADFVLAICTKTYALRFGHLTRPDEGRGVRWEGSIISQHIYDAGGDNHRFVPVLFEGSGFDDIPTILRGSTFYEVDVEDGYTRLCEWLISGRGPQRPAPLRRRVSDFLPWNVPVARNSWFTGRESVLVDLRRAFEGGDRIQALSGLGGVGKTQVAAEYAYRHRESYDAVLWARADDGAELAASISEWAVLLELDPTDPKSGDPRRAVFERLAHVGSWLLIFDNLDRPELLKPYLPRIAAGHVLITSRAQALHHVGIARPIELEQLDPEEAREFLFRRVGRRGDPVETVAAEELAAELGFLPLALEQAAAFIAEQQSRYGDYLVSYRRRRLELLEQQRPVSGDYPESVATTWTMNFGQVEARPAAADVLRASAFLGPDAIPIELLSRGASELGPCVAMDLAAALDDPVAVDQALAPLTRYSLIRRDLPGRTFSVHRLVQEVVRHSMDDAARAQWIERVIRALALAFPADPSSVDEWTAAERLMPHVRVHSAAAIPAIAVGRQAASLLHRAGRHEDILARADEAERLYTRALTLWEQAGEGDGPGAAATLNNLGVLCHQEGRYEAAEAFHLRAGVIWRRSPEHSELFVLSLHNLARLYRDSARIDEAIPLYEQVIASMEARNPEGAELVEPLTQLANVHREEGRLEVAERLYRRALAICRIGPAGVDVDESAIITALAMICHHHGRAEEAARLETEAAATRDQMVDRLVSRIGGLSGVQIEIAARRLDQSARRNRSRRAGAPGPEVSVADGESTEDPA